MTKEARKFKVCNLFEVEKVKHKLSKENLSDNCIIPAYSSDSTNGGIIGYTDKTEFCYSDVPYVLFGDHTRTFNIVRQDFAVLDNVKVLKPVFLENSDTILMYLISVWKKQIPELGYARHWKIAKDCILELPVKTDSNNKPVIDETCSYHEKGYIPDFDFMEKYIRAVEKVTVKDLVEWKDAQIEAVQRVI